MNDAIQGKLADVADVANFAVSTVSIGATERTALSKLIRSIGADS